MTDQLHKIFSKSRRNDDINVVYSIFFKNAYYNLEAYKEGYTESNDYCYIENLTDDEGDAETFLKYILNGKAYPVHIKDLADDFFR